MITVNTQLCDASNNDHSTSNNPHWRLSEPSLGSGLRNGAGLRTSSACPAMAIQLTSAGMIRGQRLTSLRADESANSETGAIQYRQRL